jgi:hypothetical protein
LDRKPTGVLGPGREEEEEEEESMQTTTEEAMRQLFLETLIMS